MQAWERFTQMLAIFQQQILEALLLTNSPDELHIKYTRRKKIVRKCIQQEITIF